MKQIPLRVILPLFERTMVAYAVAGMEQALAGTNKLAGQYADEYASMGNKDRAYHTVSDGLVMMLSDTSDSVESVIARCVRRIGGKEVFRSEESLLGSLPHAKGNDLHVIKGKVLEDMVAAVIRQCLLYEAHRERDALTDLLEQAASIKCVHHRTTPCA